MHSKVLKSVRVKDAEAGTVEAVFSRFNVIDHDGDVTLPGAFEDGAGVRISAYNHGSSLSSALPVGRGVIRQTADEAILDGQFFLDTNGGRDTFSVVKQMGELQEWSYAYDILDAEAGVWEGEDALILKRLRVNEVSPVLVGAGIGTRTLSAKQAGVPLKDNITAVLADVEALTARLEEVKSLRAGKGKDLGADARELAEQLEGRLKRLRDVMTIEPPDDNDPDDREWGARLYALAVAKGHIRGGSN